MFVGVEWLTVCMVMCGMVDHVYVEWLTEWYVWVEWLTVCMCVWNGWPCVCMCGMVDCVSMCVFNGWPMIMVGTFADEIVTGGHTTANVQHTASRIWTRKEHEYSFSYPLHHGILVILIEIYRKFWQCALEFRIREMNLQGVHAGWKSCQKDLF